MPVPFQQGVFGQHGEFQDHLVHLGFAVAPDAENPVLDAVQQPDDLFGGIAFGQVVPGPVVQQVAQKKQSVGPFGTEPFQQLPGEQGGPMDIRSNEPFHEYQSFHGSIITKKEL